MTGPDSPLPVDSLTDLESLFDHPDLAVETHTESIDAADFDAAEAWDSHVVAGVADDRGVLLYDDGHHGWTPPAFAVGDDEDAVAVARREFETLTGTSTTVDGVLHARRRTFTVDDSADDRETSVWNVVLSATPDEPLPDDPESQVEDADLVWRDAVPDAAAEHVAADVERIASTADTPVSDRTHSDPTESLTDPETLRDRDGVEYLGVTEDDHIGQDSDISGVAVVGLTNDDGALAFATFEEVTILPHAVVEPDEDYVDVAHGAADELLGIDVDLDDVVRVRRKDSPSSGNDDEDVAHVVVFTASPAGDGVLPDAEDVTSCQARATGWFERVPDDLQTEEMREDALLFVD